MQCPYPVTIKLKDPRDIELYGYHSLKVPCGKCLICKSNRRQDFATRLQLEADASISTYFVTLTYDDAHLPFGYLVDEETGEEFYLPVLVKKDLQRFFKRLRILLSRRYGKERYNQAHYRYFAVGEYGGITYRPHFHFVIFNLDEVDLPLIEKAWTDDTGLIGDYTVRAGELNAYAYCGKYMLKPPNMPSYFKGFMINSNGIGQGYLTPDVIRYHKADIENRRCIILDGHTVNMPRYLRDKIYTTQSEKDKIKKLYDKHTRPFLVSSNLSIRGDQISFEQLTAIRKRRIIDNLRKCIKYE